MSYDHRVQSIAVGKAWWQEYEEAGPTASTVRDAEGHGCWGSAHFLLFIQSRTPTHGVVLPAFRGLWTLVNLK